MKPLLITFIMFVSSFAQSQEIQVAVASNFVGVLKQVASLYEKETGQKVLITTGSTGKLYAQIINGAPFDMFFAADSNSTKLLEDKNIIKKNARFTYALGKLVLWKSNKEVSFKDTNFLSIANPKHAPYGKAAIEYLKNKNLLNTLENRIIYGQNIGQAFQFIESGNVQMGLVGHAQALKYNKGVIEEIALSHYSPLKQQVAILTDSQKTRKFTAYIKSKSIKELILNSGYDLPKDGQ